jgi:hypothetical protein
MSNSVLKAAKALTFALQIYINDKKYENPKYL